MQIMHYIHIFYKEIKNKRLLSLGYAHIPIVTAAIKCQKKLSNVHKYRQYCHFRYT